MKCKVENKGKKSEKKLRGKIFKRKRKFEPEKILVFRFIKICRLKCCILHVKYGGLKSGG